MSIDTTDLMDTITNTIPTFATSDALFAFLKSNEGGRLVIRKDMTLALIHYDKDTSYMTLPTTRLFRSSVWDIAENKLVCEGPPKMYSFTDAVTDGVGPNMTVRDFVDGVMINLFHHNGAWRIATRTVLDAECSYYGKRTFAELFWETFASVGLTNELLDSRHTYTWVLQHPEERVVVSPAYGIAQLYLVATSDDSLNPTLANLQSTRHDDVKTLEDVKERVDAYGKRFGTQWQGLIMTAPDGKMYKLRSNEYDEARVLRGNQPKRAYIWLERWSANRLPAYLRLYPEEECDANAVIASFKASTKELHDLYLKVYRKHELPLGEAPQKYRKLLWDAHQAGAGAYFPALRQFMNDQDTARKLWLVNYEVRYS